MRRMAREGKRRSELMALILVFVFIGVFVFSLGAVTGCILAQSQVYYQQVWSIVAMFGLAAGAAAVIYLSSFDD